MASSSEVQWILSHEKDYYGMLNVSKDADDSTIRKRYYALTLKLHPDKNPNDAKAAQACRLVMDAYSVLKEPSKRQVYDAYGIEGITRLEQMGGEIPSVMVMLRTIGSFLLALFLRSVGRRYLCLEQLPKVFPFTNEQEEETDVDEDASDTAARRARRQEMLFVKRHAKDRAQTRRFVLTLLLVVLVGITGASVVSHRSQRAAEMLSVPAVNASISLHPSSLLFPTFPASATEAVVSSSARDLFTFDFRCLRGALPNPTTSELASDGRARFLDCHRRHSSNAPTQHAVALYRYSGTDDDARLGFVSYMVERCAMEKELVWASRERYESLATVRRAAPLATPKSPNRSPQRKYPKHIWRPKFAESFTVGSDDELLQISSLCQHFLESV